MPFIVIWAADTYIYLAYIKQWLWTFMKSQRRTEISNILNYKIKCQLSEEKWRKAREENKKYFPFRSKTLANFWIG